SVEKVRLTSSGTEAVMGAVRLARAYTTRKKIIKFEGAYHGHADYLLAKAGSGAATLGIPNSLGVPEEFTRHTILLPYNDLKKVEDAVKRHRKELAAIIVEPVAANNGVILPGEGFLKGLSRITKKYGIVLIFDEVITGFRLSYGGAQEFFNVKPDLTCLGKIVGGGLPIGAFGGKKEIMKLLAPEGSVYQAGTLSGNPIAVTAGIVTLKTLKKNKPYRALARKTQKLCEGIRSRAEGRGIKIDVNYIGSMFSVSLKGGPFKKFFHGLLQEGVYFSPSEFESNFLSMAHSDKDIEKTLKAVENAFKVL
ncbi:MAG: glutamate-1-semialdehyde 2,1-aminomutase, partial [Candidatus Omnitrophota bacterium]